MEPADAGKDRDRRLYMAKEHYDLQHRRLVGALASLFPITLLVLLVGMLSLGWSVPWWLWVGVALAELVASAALYLAGRFLLRKLVARRYDIRTTGDGGVEVFGDGDPLR